MNTLRVGLCGATGYAGYEALRRLQRHPDAQVVFCTSETQAGKRLADVFPGPLDAPLIAIDAAPWAGIDVVLLALPHGAAAATARKARAAGVRVVDLSADLRLRTPASYAQWYGHAHPAPELLPTPYGLPEINRAALHDAPLIATPGCFPTSVLLGIAPVLRAGLLADATIIVDAKTGISGGGRAPKQQFHFPEANENVAPYNPGRLHRHVGEIEQEAARLSSGIVPEIIFTPHLVPATRGMLSTIYLRVDPALALADIRALYDAQYAAEPFVRVLPDGILAAFVHTTHTNMCAISLTLARPGLLIVASSIDNLVKGAAGQAIQNMNAMFEIDETMGLL